MNSLHWKKSVVSLMILIEMERVKLERDNISM